MTSAVEVVNLRKSYGKLVAVDDVSFTVRPRTVFGIVGPNGAGKTTTIECLEGLRKPDDGKVSVLGMNPFAERARLFRKVGVQLQESSLYNRIRAREALKLFASLYDRPLAPDQILEDLGLKEKANTYYDRLSGGQKRKLLAALALVGNPELVLLDEPTTGLDPQSRRSFWATLRKFRDNGLTILLTTHDLQEAEEECDMVCLFERGKIVALGHPSALLREYGLGMRVTIPVKGISAENRQSLAGHPNLTRFEVVDDRAYLYGTGDDFVPSLTSTLREMGVNDVAIRPARLEDLYLILTGRGYSQEGEQSH